MVSLNQCHNWIINSDNILFTDEADDNSDAVYDIDSNGARRSSESRLNCPECIIKSDYKDFNNIIQSQHSDSDYQFEKSFNRIMVKGSNYLDGLRNSLEDVINNISSCEQYTFQTNTRITDQKMLNELRRCQLILRDNEKLQTIAELALHTTDLAKQDKTFNADEEIILIAKLAKLIHVMSEKAGYKPEVSFYFDADPESEIKKREANMDDDNKEINGQYERKDINTFVEQKNTFVDSQRQENKQYDKQTQDLSSEKQAKLFVKNSNGYGNRGNGLYKREKQHLFVPKSNERKKREISKGNYGGKRANMFISEKNNPNKFYHNKGLTLKVDKLAKQRFYEISKLKMKKVYLVNNKKITNKQNKKSIKKYLI